MPLQRAIPSVMQMKKAPGSPLIISPGHIRKQENDSDHRIIANYSGRSHHKNNNSSSAFSYIRSAAKKVDAFVSRIFFRQEKNGAMSKSKSARDQVNPNARHYQPGGSPYLSNSSTSQSRHSYYDDDAPPEIDISKLRSSLSFEEIYKATGNFSPENIVGEGGFGTVYKGKLKNGVNVAVKRAKKENYDQRLSAEFKNEILALSKIEHLSLIRFYGYLEHRDERLIVVEYVSNGTLREHLDGIRGSDLQTGERLDIAIDVSHAITYLHTYTDPPIIHRDIKSSNILITSKLRAKVADFGFARIAIEDPSATHISTQIKGTSGYMDPVYLRTYQLTEKSDVYSFGVLLVELMTGRRPIESKRTIDERVTTKWALKRLKDGESVVAMDPKLPRSPASVRAVERVFKLARHCLAPSRLSRPSMRKCAEMLWNIRKEFRDSTVTYAAANSFHSANIVERYERTSRRNMFGIEDSDSLMFVSA